MRPLCRLSVILLGCLAVAPLAAAADAPSKSGGPIQNLDVPASGNCQSRVSSSVMPAVPRAVSSQAMATVTMLCHWAFLEYIYPDESREPGTECGTYESCNGSVDGCETPYRSRYKEYFRCC
jgi:hypothetical protein